jgi:broad specificity phosphatase PhoE
MIFDPRLSAEGERQVAALRHRVAALAVEVVITSPLTRAIQTALGAFAGQGVPILVEALHREWLEHSGDVGRAPSLLAAEFPELIFDHLPDVWWHSAGDAPLAVPSEPEEVLLERVEAFRNWLLCRTERRIAVIGHGTFLNRLSGHAFANCELYTLTL